LGRLTLSCHRNCSPVGWNTYSENWSNKHDLIINSRKPANIRAANNGAEKQETVNGPTKPHTDAGLKINKKKTEVMTNSTDTYIKLNREALDYVPE
jgi:hypothetical protein